MSANGSTHAHADLSKAELQKLVHERQKEAKHIRHQTIALHGSLLKQQERLISIEHSLGVLEGELQAKHGVKASTRPTPIHHATAKQLKTKATKPSQPAHPDFVHDLYVENGVMSLIEAGLAAEREMGKSAGEVEAMAESTDGMIDIVAAAENGELK